MIIAIIEIYAFQAVKTFTKVKWVKLTYIIISVLAVAFVFYGFSKFDRGVGQTQMFMMTIGVMLLVIVPKLLITFIMLLEDTLRLMLGTKNYFTNYKHFTLQISRILLYRLVNFQSISAPK